MVIYMKYVIKYTGDNRTIKNEIKKLIIDENITFTEISNRMGIAKNQLNNTFSKVNLSFNDIFKILDVIGYDLQIDFVKREKDN